MIMPQYNIPANSQAAAAQQMMASQQKQAQMFKGGGVQAPDMGGNSQTQSIANDLTSRMAQQNSQAINDQRYKGGNNKKISRRRKKISRRRKKSTKSKKNTYRNK